MKKQLLYIFCVSLLLTLLAFAAPHKKIKVWMIGDSTMCEYTPDRSPLTGWGMPFAGFFDSSVLIDNRARGGRSTRTFISENRWQPIADSMQEGDYVLMQFGHNDEAKEERYKDRYTPVADYRNNLTKFISETRAKKGIPVLITPVTRLSFDKEGKIKETHKEYSAAVREVGAATGTPVIDLDERSRELLQQYGPVYAKLLYMNLDSLANPHYPEGLKDNTHFNEYGARIMAELVLKEIKKLNLGLAERIVSPAVKKQ
ncbi:MAG: rhamnogalacturonan acetylesterase [Ferruginibacter sp.]